MIHQGMKIHWNNPITPRVLIIKYIVYIYKDYVFSDKHRAVEWCIVHYKRKIHPPCRDFSCSRSHSTPECDEAFST